MQPKFHSAQGLDNILEDFEEMDRDYDWTEEKKEVRCFTIPKIQAFTLTPNLKANNFMREEETPQSLASGIQEFNLD